MVSENRRNKTVCVCMHYAMTVRCDWRLRQPCCVTHAHSNTAIQLNTCTKLVLNLLSVSSELISINATMQCDQIANHTNIIKWRYKKTWNIKSILHWQIVLKKNSFSSNYRGLCLFLSNDQVAEGGGQVHLPAPPWLRPWLLRQEKSEYGKKWSGHERKEVLKAYQYLLKYNHNKHYIIYMIVFYKIWKNYNEIQLTKNKLHLNNRKMKNHSRDYFI